MLLMHEQHDMSAHAFVAEEHWVDVVLTVLGCAWRVVNTI